MAYTFGFRQKSLEMDLVSVIQTNLALSDAKIDLSESNNATARSKSHYFPSDHAEDFMANSLAYRCGNAIHDSFEMLRGSSPSS